MRSCTGCSSVPDRAVAGGTPAARLQAIWYRAARPPLLLRLLSRLFGLAVKARRTAYARGLCRAQRLPRPVIVVGNLTVGGSGKTPLVIWLAERLRSQGLRPGVILRGYGGSAERGGEACSVEPDSDAAIVGDEALVLRRRTGLPVVVCRVRTRAARHLLLEGVDVILADDGLQHLQLARDCEIAVLDAQRGLGNGHLLPAGPLREPAARLAAMDIVVVNGEGDAAAGLERGAGGPGPFVMHVGGEWLRPLDGAGGPVALSSLAGQEVHAVAGIGDPKRFFMQLAAAGLRVQPHVFPDHHRYRAADLAFDDRLPLLMTEKDAVKCGAFGAANRWYLPVTASFAAADAGALLARLRSCLVRSGH